MAKSRYLPQLVCVLAVCFCGYTERGVVAVGSCPGEPGSPLRYEKAEAGSTGMRAVVSKIYTAELGVKEATGNNDGPRVAEYLGYTNLGPGYNWCAAFICWCLGKAGLDNPRNPWSPALFLDKRVVRDLPQTADVFGIYFTDLKRIAHVGFIDEWKDDYVITVEGNSDNAVIRKRRPQRSIYKIANWIDD